MTGWLTSREARERLGLTPSQLKVLRRSGWLTTERFDEHGRPCRHGELLDPCRCDLDAHPASWGNCPHFTETSRCRCSLRYRDDEVHYVGTRLGRGAYR
jgi:hypothetical protein